MQKTGLWWNTRLALILGLALGVAGMGAARASQKLFTANPPATLKLADPNLGPSKASFAPVVKAVLPSVVNISSSKVVRTPNQLSGQVPMMDPFFRQFFGDDGRINIPKERREQSLGS